MSLILGAIAVIIGLLKPTKAAPSPSAKFFDGTIPIPIFAKSSSMTLP